MQKQAPSVGRILVAIGFSLSCFGLILFLWVAFGGPTPLKSKSYRFSAYFPEAITLAAESDVRIGGVSVGKVKAVEVGPRDARVDGYDTAEAVVEIKPEFAPIATDARAVLRQKTLLGETYVELTPGSETADGDPSPVSLGAATTLTDAEVEAAAEPLEEGATLAVGQTRNAVQIDEIFNALDTETREAFQRWQAAASVASAGRGLDLNDAFGNLGPFITDASQILAVLKGQKVALKGLVRDTGTVFEALSERDQELAGAITGGEATFGGLADADAALAESFQILPTFQRESRATLERLDDFQATSRPVIQKLLPVANDISPTLESVRKLSPHLERLFRKLDPLIDVSKRGLPALRRLLGGEGLRPALDALEPVLANVNPALAYLKQYKNVVTDFLAVPGYALSNTLPTQPGQPTPRTYLRQIGYTSAETLSIHPSRLPTNRGNGYPAPNYLTTRETAEGGIFPNFDCKNTDFTPGLGGDPDEDELAFRGPANPGEGVEQGQSTAFAACFIQTPPFFFGGGRAPNILADP